MTATHRLIPQPRQTVTLLGAVIDRTLERHRDLLKRGAVLVDERDERDEGDRPRVLF